MRARKSLRRLGLVVAVGSIVFGMLPAHATGSSATVTDSKGDVIDYSKHPQNSLRPDGQYPSPYTKYNYMCHGENPTVPNCGLFDIKQSQIASDSTAQVLKFSMTLNGAMPKVGDGTDAIPAPFQNGVYEFNFATTSQDRRQKIGVDCVGKGYAPDPNYNVDDETVLGTGVKIKYSGISPDPAPQYCTKAADESKGQAGTGTLPVEDIVDVTTPPHPASDGWLGVVVVEFGASAAGSTRGDGSGPLACAGGAGTCVDYDMQVGGYEGYGQVALEQDMRDYDPTSQSKMGFKVIQNCGGASTGWLQPFGTGAVCTTPAVGQTTIVAQVPWNPTIISADGDGLIDDTRIYPWPFASTLQVNKITNFVAETTASISAGVNTVPQVGAVCTGDSDNIFPESVDPLKNPVGTTLGGANHTVHDQTKPVDQVAWDNTKGSDPDNDPTTDPAGSVKKTVFDDPNQSGEQGQSVMALAQDAWYDFGLGTKKGDYTQPDGFWLFGNGGHDQGDCIRGLYGLLTVLDWTDNGFELRLYPRSPSYTFNYLDPTTNAGCRYPLGQTPTPLNVQLGQTSAPSADVSDSPYDSPYTVQPYLAGDPVGSPVSGPTVPHEGQHVGPLDGTVGKDQACNYAAFYPGIHYKDILGDFSM